MQIEYIGELLQDGRLSVDPATQRILDRINNAKPISAPDDPRMFRHSKLAEERINKLCDELRIFNPLVSQVTFEVFDN